MPKPVHVVAAGAVALCALLAVGVGAQSKADDPSTVRYRGRVVDTVIGAPLPGTEVTCTAPGGVTYRAKTDERGEYALTSTVGACERIVFEQNGFVSERLVSPAAGVLDVSMNIGTLGPIERVAWRGLVVNADGTPAVDASVWLWRLGAAPGWGSRTDIDGTFEMPVYDFGGDFALCARGAGEGQRAACLAFNAGDPFPGGKPRLQLPPRAK